MPLHDLIGRKEADDAAWAAGKGALIGAARWGAGSAVLGALAYARWPVYRSTTVQFKVYLQMSGMVMGGMIEGDQRLRAFEHQMKMQRRWQREKAKWERYEQEFAAQNEKEK